MCVCVLTFTVRSGYQLKASPAQDSIKVLYYIEKELAQFPRSKMAAFKCKPAQIRLVSLICVAVCAFICMYVLYVHGLWELNLTSCRLILSYLKKKQHLSLFSHSQIARLTCGVMLFHEFENTQSCENM